MTSDTPAQSDGFVVVALDAAVPTVGEPSVSMQDSRAQAIRRRRNSFRAHLAPEKAMGGAMRGWLHEPDLDRRPPEEIAPLIEWFEREPDFRERFRWVLRDSLDELLDGQRTGRWAYQHLSKTEKTHLGTVVEVNLTKEFEMVSGVDLDWQIAGRDIDCKFSKDLGGWEIPMEMYRCPDHSERAGKNDHPALLTWLNDDASQWAAGVVIATDEHLRWKADKHSGERVRAYNRDNKRRFDPSAAASVYWLWGGIQPDLPRNLLLHLDPDARDRIFSYPSSGQKRVNQLFREVQGQLVGRQTVLTVAQQDDAPKRVRDARKALRPEGVLVLGHQDAHRLVADVLGLPLPVKGEWIAVRVSPVSATDGRPSFVVNGQRWVAAMAGEPPVRAPDLPKLLET